MDTELKSSLKELLIESIRGYFKKKLLNGISTHNILDLLFPIERRIRSLIGGLETSMGTVVWEEIAKELARRNGFKVIDIPLLAPVPFPNNLRHMIDELCNSRAEGNFVDTQTCLKQIREILDDLSFQGTQFLPIKKKGHGVDLWLEKDDKEYMFDLKSGQPNAGDFPRYCRQLLDWYSYRLSRDPSVSLEARIAFLFNPYKRNWYDEQKTKISQHLDLELDIFVEDEFWDFCSGYKNTSQTFFELFTELREENFDLEFKDIFYQDSQSPNC